MRGEIITQRQPLFYEVFTNQAAFCRKLSISFSQAIMWFQVGMLWDANFLKHF